MELGLTGLIAENHLLGFILLMLLLIAHIVIILYVINLILCDKFNPFIDPSLASWDSCVKRVARGIPSWVFNNVVEIGIACSYMWLKNSAEQKAVIEEVFEKLPEWSKRKMPWED